MPAQHGPFFEDSQSDSLDRLAPVLFELLRRIEEVVPESAYNMLVRTAPWVDGGQTRCHWRIEILPRTSAFAGFELASGMFINPSRQNAPPANSGRSSFFCGSDLNSDDPVN